MEMHLQLPLTRFVFWQAHQNVVNGNVHNQTNCRRPYIIEGKTVLLYLDQTNTSKPILRSYKSLRIYFERMS